MQLPVDVPTAMISDPTPPRGAAAAIIVTPDERYLLQHRDDTPGIWFPGFWGLFGGAIDDGETPAAALARELAEELDLRPPRMTYFTQIGFDLRCWGLGIRLRYMFEVPLAESEIRRLVLREGQAMRLYTVDELLREPRLTPYDSHALRLHVTRSEIERARGIA